MIHAAVQITAVAAQQTAIFVATVVFIILYAAACIAVDWVAKRQKEVAARRIARGQRW